MRKSIGAVLLAFASLGLATPNLLARGPVGTSQADQPTSKGQFIITNQSSHNITYLVRWGNGRWEASTLAPGEGFLYSCVLDSAGRAPRPQVQFASVADGKPDGLKVYDMEFCEVDVGQTGTTGSPKPYVFQDAGANVIDLFAR
jgi:hypothetical protein